MATLLLAEVHDGRLNDITAKALTAALAIGEPVHVLVAGSDVRGAAEAAAKLDGVAKVHLAEGPLYAHDLAEPARRASRRPRRPPSRADGGRVVAVEERVSARRGAARRDAGSRRSRRSSRPTRSSGRSTPANAIQTVRSSDRVKVVTVRASAFAATPAGTAAAPIETLAAAADPGLSTFEGEAMAASDRPELAGAKIVVSGGRAIGSAENFKSYIEPVADALGAAVGASRAAVDAGFAPNDWQVGQTGKVVAPRALRGDRHLRGDPASRRHEGFEGHRRHQQGRGRADLPRSPITASSAISSRCLPELKGRAPPKRGDEPSSHCITCAQRMHFVPRSPILGTAARAGRVVVVPASKS